MLAVEPRPAAGRSQSARLGDDWWRDGVVYQIYPRSFADHDGDGIGRPAPGSSTTSITSGPTASAIDAIWLSPIYPSPGRDLGYDVSDHTPSTRCSAREEDFDRLVAGLPSRAGSG